MSVANEVDSFSSCGIGLPADNDPPVLAIRRDSGRTALGVVLVRLLREGQHGRGAVEADSHEAGAGIFGLVGAKVASGATTVSRSGPGMSARPPGRAFPAETLEEIAGGRKALIVGQEAQNGGRVRGESRTWLSRGAAAFRPETTDAQA